MTTVDVIGTLVHADTRNCFSCLVWKETWSCLNENNWVFAPKCHFTWNSQRAGKKRLQKRRHCTNPEEIRVSFRVELGCFIERPFFVEKRAQLVKASLQKNVVGAFQVLQIRNKKNRCMGTRKNGRPLLWFLSSRKSLEFESSSRTNSCWQRWGQISPKFWEDLFSCLATQQQRSCHIMLVIEFQAEIQDFWLELVCSGQKPLDTNKQKLVCSHIYISPILGILLTTVVLHWCPHDSAPGSCRQSPRLPSAVTAPHPPGPVDPDAWPPGWARCPSPGCSWGSHPGGVSAGPPLWETRALPAGHRSGEGMSLPSAFRYKGHALVSACCSCECQEFCAEVYLLFLNYIFYGKFNRDKQFVFFFFPLVGINFCWKAQRWDESLGALLSLVEVCNQHALWNDPLDVFKIIYRQDLIVAALYCANFIFVCVWFWVFFFWKVQRTCSSLIFTCWFSRISVSFSKSPSAQARCKPSYPGHSQKKRQVTLQEPKAHGFLFPTLSDLRKKSWRVKIFFIFFSSG